jgi:Fe-S-cluster containining protein
MEHYQLPLQYNPCSVRLFHEFFTCQKCGQCCHYDKVAMFEEDVRRLERYGLPREYVMGLLSFDEGRAYMRTTGGCPFLNEKNECEVYEARPDTCWRYPLQYPKDGRIVVRGVCQAAKDAIRLLSESEEWPITGQDSVSEQSQNTEARASSLSES